MPHSVCGCNYGHEHPGKPHSWEVEAAAESTLEERIWCAIRPYFAQYGSTLGGTDWRYVGGDHARCVHDIVAAIQGGTPPC